MGYPSEASMKFGRNSTTEKSVQLDTLVKQTAARHLYEKNGYQTLRKETLTIQGKPYDIIFYEKKLSHSL
jgi:hypothetical protein